MKIQQRNLKRHLFICTNERNCGEDCATKDARELIKELKTRLRENDLWNDIKVSKAGCLGACAFGITATLYPDNKLLTGLTFEDADELYQILIS